MSDVPPPAIPESVTRARLGKLSARKRWLFRLIAVGLGLSVLVAVELALRLAGVGHDCRLIVPVANSPGWCQLNPHFDEPFFGRVDLSGPEPRPFRLPKPTGVRRIVVVGGSTVAGFPYPAELAFPRQLQEQLQAQVREGRTIEVLNAGITALNTVSESVAVEEALACEPDLVVVYTGHNEFYGPGGALSAPSDSALFWFRSLASLRRLRLAQLIGRAAGISKPPSKDLLELLSTNLQIPLEGPVFRAAVDHFRDNLERMVAATRRRGIPLMLVTPLSNLRDQPPIEPAGPQVEAWGRTLAAARKHLQDSEFQAALETLKPIESDAKGIALFHYRLAQAYDGLGHRESALTHYQLAVDCDGARFRAPSALVEVVKSVATRHRNDKVHLLDLAEALRTDTSPPPGHELFLEHVHFTWKGNYQIGSALARAVATSVWQERWFETRMISAEKMHRQLFALEEEHLAASVSAVMVYRKPPFKYAVDAEQLAARLGSGVARQLETLEPERRAAFEKLSSEEMTLGVVEPLLRLAQNGRREHEQGRLLEALVRRQPWRCELRTAYHTWLVSHHRTDAAKALEEASSNWPCPIDK